MKANVEKVSNLQRKLNIEIPAAVVKTAFDKMFTNIQKQADIKGFRKGKAPMATIKSIYADRVKQDVVQDLISTHYYKAVQEHSLDPISYPQFEFDEPTTEKDFAFSAAFEVRPEVALKKYEGLEIEKEKYEFEQTRLDDILNNIRKSRAEEVTVLEDRGAQMGDVAVIDFEGFMDGAPLENGAGTDHNLELGSNSFIEGYEEAIVGMKVGSTKTISLKFPTPYHAANLEGKPVDFKVTLKTLKKKILPELTDELLQSIGSKETVAELIDTIKKDIEETEKKRIETDIKNRLLKKLVAQNPVEVPASMLEEQKNALIEDMKNRMTQQGLSAQDFESYKQKWDGDFAKTAAEMIQSSFLVDAIAVKHELKSNKEDFENKMEEYAKQTGIEITRIKEFYGTPEQTSRLNFMITEEKVISFLMNSAKVKEVSKKDLSDKN